MDIPSYLSGALYIKSYKILRENVGQCLARYGISPTEWSFLGAIASSPDGIRPVALAGRLNVKAPLITVMANRLLKRGSVKRIPHHSDGRAKLLVLTPQGKQFMKSVEKDMDATLLRLLDGLTKSDLDAYKKVLDTIISNGTK